MKAVIKKSGERWLAIEGKTQVEYEVMQDYIPLREGQIVWGLIVEHSNQHRIHQMYFELYDPQPNNTLTELATLRKEIQDRDKRLVEMAEALDRIANPLKWMQKDLKEGYALNGQMAVELSNNPAHLKNIAEIALKFYEEYKKPKQ